MSQLSRSNCRAQLSSTLLLLLLLSLMLMLLLSLPSDRHISDLRTWPGRFGMMSATSSELADCEERAL